MSKRRLSATAVHTNDWMRYRAYPRFRPEYDGFYLRLSNEVFAELNHPDRFFRNMLRREQVVDLAVVLVSWFEDYANEIGLWDTYVRKNKELYGYRLPFFRSDDAVPDEMHPADIAYLCWHYCCKAAEKFIGPDSPGLLEIARALLALFEEALDEAPGTDHYDEFLRFGEDIPFFELKTKLYWIALQSYLNGPEFQRMLQEAIREFAEEQPEFLGSVSDPGKILYAMQDDYLYKKSSSFLAFTAPEWLAEVARCPDSLRDDIRRLFRRVPGEFVYESAGDRYYRFRHTYTKRLFEVRRESVELKGVREGELVVTTLVNWRGEWWVSGILSGAGDTQKARSKQKDFDPSTISFYAWDDDKQQLMREMCDEMEAAHLGYFGDALTFFGSEKEMRAALEDWQKYYAGQKKGSKAEGSLGARLMSAFKSGGGQTTRAGSVLRSPAELPKNKGIAVYYEPGKGVLMSPLVAWIAQCLEQPELGDDEAQPLFFEFFSQCSPDLARYLVERFSAHNLRFPTQTKVPLMPHFEFLLRYYNPGAFREITPNNTLLAEEE